MDRPALASPSAGDLAMTGAPAWKSWRSWPVVRAVLGSERSVVDLLSTPRGPVSAGAGGGHGAADRGSGGGAHRLDGVASAAACHIQRGADRLCRVCRAVADQLVSAGTDGAVGEPKVCARSHRQHVRDRRGVPAVRRVYWGAAALGAGLWGYWRIGAPFAPGESVQLNALGVAGTVRTIGFYKTELIGPDGRPTWIPNSQLVNERLTNGSRITQRRFAHTFGVRYMDIDKVERIVTRIQELLESLPSVDRSSVSVHFVGYTEYALQIQASCFFDDTDGGRFMERQQLALIGISDCIRAEGADFAFRCASSRAA
eukprot:ctg_2817.g558